jgi:hypothetical protein
LIAITILSLSESGGASVDILQDGFQSLIKKMTQLPHPDKQSLEGAISTSVEVNHWHSTSQIYPDTDTWM